jgi:GR25 family glycosyltransferase involved in LPS biosynthesis/glycosyltransferase involved in cell wall biosynthesis
MKILIYVGYQKTHFNSKTAKTTGVGGSEYAAIEIAERLALMGKQYQVDVVGDVVPCTFKSVNYIQTENFKQLCLQGIMGDKVGHVPSYDLVIAINYIHYLEELTYINYSQSIFWLHNHEHFPWHNGDALPNNGDDLYKHPKMTLVVATSQYQANVISEKYGIGDKVRIIGNGINTELFPNDLVNVKHPGQRFIYSSAPDRGLVLLWKMWPKIKRLMPQATLTVFCPPYASEHLTTLANKYNAWELVDVDIRGAVSQRELYSQMVDSTIWCYPSRYDETFCITALEAMYARCTVVSTDTANLGSLLKNRAYLVDHTLNDDDMTTEFLRHLRTIADQTHIEQLDKCYDNHAYAASQHWREKAIDWDWLIQQKTTKTLVDVAYVISLHTPTEKTYADWNKKLLNAGIQTHSIIHWPAVNGNIVDHEYLKQHEYRLFNWKQPQSDNHWFNRDMLPGEIGCAISHLTLWKHIDASNAGLKRFNNVLILEDDFEPTATALTDDVVKQLPVDWDMLYLGRNALTDEDYDSDAKIIKPGRSYNLHAYMLSPMGAKKLVDQQFQRKIMPVDEFIQATYTKHIREDLHHIWADSKVYAVAKNVLKQDGKKNETETIHLTDSTTNKVEVPQYTISTVSNNTIRVHPELYTYFEDPQAWITQFLVPGVVDKQWDLVCDEPIDHVHCVRFFSEKFCEYIREEAEATGQWTTDRHEFYPTTDMLLDVLGFNDIYNDLIIKYFMPMAINRFGLDGVPWTRMYSENFIAKYTPDTQAQLAIHHDASDITTLVNLSKPDVEFEGGGTWFPKYKKLYRPPQGSVSIHPGNITHKHGARVVLSGSRYILVSFMSRAK